MGLFGKKNTVCECEKCGAKEGDDFVLDIDLISNFIDAWSKNEKIDYVTSVIFADKLAERCAMKGFFATRIVCLDCFFELSDYDKLKTIAEKMTSEKKNDDYEPLNL